MPGRLMFDGRDPDLFNHFAAVAQRLGVYTVEDYAKVVEHLVRAWNVAGRSVSGKAARAQEFLCKHAENCRSMAPQVAEMAAKQPPVPFGWVFGRAV
jgi:acyl-[acyl-carrier-protein] desaturase